MFEKSKRVVNWCKSSGKSIMEWNLLERKFHLESCQLAVALFKRAYISHTAYMSSLDHHSKCVDRIDEQIRSRHFTLLRDCY